MINELHCCSSRVLTELKTNFLIYSQDADFTVTTMNLEGVKLMIDGILFKYRHIS